MGLGFRVSLVCSSIWVVVKTGVPSEVHKLYSGAVFRVGLHRVPQQGP